MKRTTFPSVFVGLCLSLFACKGGEGSPDSASTSESEEGATESETNSGTESASASSTTTSASGDGDSADAGDGDGDSAEESTTGPMECGNGIVEGNEECDDGPDGSSICSPDCLYKTECAGTVWQCGDGIDNDEDGEIDNQDSDCFGPCDDNEGGWKGLIPGQNDNCQVDCYFDDDNGNGSDLCKWSFACDPLEPMNPPDPSCAYVDADMDDWGDENVSGAPNTYNDCEDLFTPEGPDGPGQDPDCWDPDGTLGGENACGALTPPGCDCFGCCAVPNGACSTDGDCDGEGGVCDTETNLCIYTIYLGSQNESNPNDIGSCNAAELKTPVNCHPCTRVEACINDCDNTLCELCFGQTFEDLPDECDEQACDEGLLPCETIADCPEPLGAFACIAGCCAPTPG